MKPWVRDSIWWQVYPLGFTGASVRPLPSDTPGDSVGRGLSSLVPWLDYLIDLGANGLALGPIFRSETHGYDTVDFFSIDPRLGDIDDFDRMMGKCRAKGIKVMLDGVFNHVGTAHPLFVSAMRGDDSARSMFRVELAEDGSVRGYQDFEGHRGLAVLNHDSSEVCDLVVDVMRHWLRRGVSGWRLDAAYSMNPNFWGKVLPQVRSEFPEAFFVGEVIHGDYGDIVRKSGMDSVTQYELWKAVWSSLKDGNFFELDWCLKRHNSFMNSFVPATFVGNHDVTRLATTIGDDLMRLAIVILFTVGGVPSVYYGDEQAFRGEKKDMLGGDDEVRPEFPETPEELSPLGAGMYRLHQDLIALRRRHPWLVGAKTRPIELDNRAYSYESVGDDGQVLAVTMRLDPAPLAIVSANGQEFLRVGG